MESPHPKLVALLQKHSLDWSVFVKRGRPPGGVREKRSAIVTELHESGYSWADMMTITGLSNGAIQRLTQAMWNPESRENVRQNMKKVGGSWRGKKRPGQLEAQWGKGDFDSPETRAKYSATAIRTLQKYPNRAYPQGTAEVVRTLKGETFEVRVRSSYEKKAVALLDNDPCVLSYQYELPIVLPDGKRILPDFVVKHTDGACVLIEVKASWVLHDPKRRTREWERLAKAEQAALARGWSFVLWTEKELGLCSRKHSR